jgi:acyl-coenzyme A synthetase/AMP-(fatty) acid ligase
MQGGKRQLNEKLKQHLLSQFERVTLPRYFRYVERLPVDERGKTTASSLRALFLVSQNENS